MRRLPAESKTVRWVWTSRQSPQALEILRNSASIQRRAAPMPRVAETVSLSVWRVPKLTSVVTSARMRAGSGASAMAMRRGWRWASASVASFGVSPRVERRMAARRLFMTGK